MYHKLDKNKSTYIHHMNSNASVKPFTHADVYAHILGGLAPVTCNSAMIILHAEVSELHLLD